MLRCIRRSSCSDHWRFLVLEKVWLSNRSFSASFWESWEMVGYQDGLDIVKALTILSPSSSYSSVFNTADIPLSTAKSMIRAVHVSCMIAREKLTRPPT